MKKLLFLVLFCTFAQVSFATGVFYNNSTCKVRIHMFCYDANGCVMGTTCPPIVVNGGGSAALPTMCTPCLTGPDWGYLVCFASNTDCNGDCVRVNDNTTALCFPTGISFGCAQCGCSFLSWDSNGDLVLN